MFATIVVATSLLAACAPSGGGGSSGPPPAVPDTFVLGDSISANWPAFVGYLPISAPGADLQYLRDLIPLMADVPETLVVMGGVNDIIQGHTLSQMQTVLNGIVADLDTLGVDRIVIATITGFGDSYVPASALPTLRSKRVAYNDWIRATFSDVADCASVHDEPPSTTYGYSDGIHPDYNGELYLAACMQLEVG